MGASEAFELANSNGELLLMLLIAFALGALFGRTLLTQFNGRRDQILGSKPLLPAAINYLPEVSTPDDLKKIPGIGPKVEEALSASGIRTFAQLAQSSPERLQNILQEAGVPSAGSRAWPMLAAFLSVQKHSR